MNSKKKTSCMSKDDQPTHVPKLRFPEFRETGGWESKSLANYLVDCSRRVPSDTKLPIYSSTREGLKRQDKYFDGRILQNNNEYGVVPPDCFVYRHMSDDGLFKFNINETGEELAVSKEYPVFRTKDLDSYFLLAKLNDSLDFQQFAFSQKAGGTRTRLYFGRLCEWNTLLPSVAEQKKIADCLKSVDELIAGQARKIDVLKAHKKGLMQQLFPREGETLPRLRFAEFEEPWTESQLKNLCISISSGRDKLDSNGTVVLYGSTSIIGKTKNPSYSGERILVARVGANAGLLTKAKGVFGVTDNTLVISLTPTTNANFLLHYLENININRLIFGSGQPLITGSILKNLPILVPSDLEQRKMSACLSSLDELIVVQSRKLESLKIHKKGLTQKIFPSPEEGEV